MKSVLHSEDVSLTSDANYQCVLLKMFAEPAWRSFFIQGLKPIKTIKKILRANFCLEMDLSDTLEELVWVGLSPIIYLYKS